jgi:hypothetical protein
MSHKKPPEQITYPKLICEVCGFKNQLKFEPKVRLELLQDVVCSSCQHYAYWERHGQKPGDEHFNFEMEQDKFFLKR